MHAWMRNWSHFQRSKWILSTSQHLNELRQNGWQGAFCTRESATGNGGKQALFNRFSHNVWWNFQEEVIECYTHTHTHTHTHSHIHTCTHIHTDTHSHTSEQNAKSINLQLKVCVSEGTHRPTLMSVMPGWLIAFGSWEVTLQEKIMHRMHNEARTR